MEQHKKESKQIGINMIANIISYSSNILISFVLTPFLINTLGKDTYSFYPIANTMVSYMSILTNSMNSIASRFVTVSLVKGDEKEANKYYSSVLATNALLGIILLVPMILVVVFLDKFMEIPINSVAAVKALFSFVFAAAIVNILGSILGIATFSKNRIDLRSLRELVTALLRLVLFVVLYKFLPASIVYVGIVTLTVALVNLLFQYKYTKMLLPEIHVSKSNISISHTKELFSSSVWNMVNTFGNNLLASMSLILANMLYGAAASGTYSIVQTVPSFINGIISMFVGVFYPIITYRYAENDKKGLISEINHAQKIIGAFACATIVVFSALASEFFTLWTPGEDCNYLSLLSLLTILPHMCIACLWSLTNLNVVMNKLKIPALFTLTIGVLNVTIAYITYKVANPGLLSLPIISSLLQIVWIGIFIPQYACRNLQVKWNTFYGPLGRAVCCGVPVAIFVLVMKKFFILDSWIKFILFGGIMGGITLIVFGIEMLGFNTVKMYASNMIQKIFNRK